MTQLAENTVEFKAEGVAAIIGAIDNLGKEVKTLTEGINTFGKAAGENLQKKFTESQKAASDSVSKLSEQLKSLQAGVQTIGTIAQLTFAAQVVSAVQSWTRAGLAASSMGEVLQFQFQRLSLSVAGLFAPEIRKVTELVTRFTDWLNRMSAAQRENLARWLMGTAAAITTAAVIPQVIRGVLMLTEGVKALTAAFVAGNAATGNILPLLGLLAGGLAAVAVGTEVGRGAFDKFWESIAPLAKAASDIFGEMAKALEPIAAVAVQVFETIAGAVAAVMPAVTEALKTLGGALMNVFVAFAPSIQQFAELFAKVLEDIAPLLPMIAGLASTVISLLMPAFEAFEGVIMAVLQAFEPFIGILVNLLGEVLEAITPLLQEIGELAQALVEVLLPAFEAIMEVVHEIIDALGQELVSWLAQVAKVIVHALLEPLRLMVWLLKQAVHAMAALLGIKLKTDVPELEKLKKEPGNRGALPMKLSGFEGVDETFRRVAQASVRATAGIKTPEEKQLEELEKIKKATEDTAKGIGGLKPAFVGRG